MTTQEHARIVNTYLVRGRVSKKDHEILACAKPLTTPLGSLLGRAVVDRAKTLAATCDRTRPSSELQRFVASPIGRGFISSRGAL